MAQELQNLKPVHKTVARYLALGLSLTEICKSLGLNLDSWYNITNGELFKDEVRRVQGEIENSIIEDQVQDPILVKLRSQAAASVDRLAEERDSFEKELHGSTSATRISASRAILETLGYTGAKDPGQKNIVVINLSPSKLEKLMGPQDLQVQPAEIHA